MPTRARPSRSSSTCRCRRTARPGAATSDILVATARDDHEAPVAFDIRGRRRVLSADTPPATPVLALVPVETDFGADSINSCCPGRSRRRRAPPPGPPPTPPAGLYMTSAHFVDDFEGWLKGDPEYEIHILGQSGSSDSLTSYQCAGEHAGGSYAFDQNDHGLERQRAAVQPVAAQQPTRRPTRTRTCGSSRSRMTTAPARSGWMAIGSRRFRPRCRTHYPNLTGGKDTHQRAGQDLQAGQRAAEDSSGGVLLHHLAGRPHRQRHRGHRGRRVPQRAPTGSSGARGNVTNGWLKLQMR